MPHDNCEDRFLEMATQPANRATKPRSGRRRRAGYGRERVGRERVGHFRVIESASSQLLAKRSSNGRFPANLK